MSNQKPTFTSQEKQAQHDIIKAIMANEKISQIEKEKYLASYVFLKNYYSSKNGPGFISISCGTMLDLKRLQAENTINSQTYLQVDKLFQELHCKHIASSEYENIFRKPEFLVDIKKKVQELAEIYPGFSFKILNKESYHRASKVIKQTCSAHEIDTNGEIGIKTQAKESVKPNPDLINYSERTSDLLASLEEDLSTAIIPMLCVVKVLEIEAKHRSSTNQTQLGNQYNDVKTLELLKTALYNQCVEKGGTTRHRAEKAAFSSDKSIFQELSSLSEIFISTLPVQLPFRSRI